MPAQYTAVQRCLSLLKPKLSSIVNFVHCLSRFQVHFYYVIQVNSGSNIHDIRVEKSTYICNNRFLKTK
jgi:hypothetical protein